MRQMKMFPLGTVLFPRGVLPLHIFETRYLAMINEAISDDGTFGVVLIERGFEVGGGDERFAVGTTAQIVRAGLVEDTRMAIVTVGTARFRVEEWLEDKPYPRAMVADHPQEEPAGELGEQVEAAHRSWRRLVALASELGADVGDVNLTLPDDPGDAVWMLCAISPLEQIDRQRLLEESNPSARATQLREALDDHAGMLEARLAGGFG